MTLKVGAESNVTTLRSVLVKSVEAGWCDQSTADREWQSLHYPASPDYPRAVDEHQALVALLRDQQIEVHHLPAAGGTGLDSIYTHDPLIVTSRGAILCRMGKPARCREPEAARLWLEAAGIPVLGAIEGDGLLEGGDLVWLGPGTVAVGEGYRTNAEGIRQVRKLLAELVDEVIPVPLPHWSGPGDCLHLMSLISPVDIDLAVVHSPLLPVPFRRLLLDRGYDLVEAPEPEFVTMGPNVLALGPRR
ncbi:MAG: arginine deiminase family protein, partial [Gemmatimonadota bacterium]